MEDFQIIDNCLMVRMPEEVDHHRASYICEGADRLLVRENVENVVFDFEDTRFMDSSGIGIIMGRYRKISCFGGHLCDPCRPADPADLPYVRASQDRQDPAGLNVGRKILSKMKEIIQKIMKNSAIIGAEMRRTW